MRREKGFTLLEVLISAVLIIIGVGSIGLTVVSLRRFFKDSEDRSHAMRLASAKIEECLAKGYSAFTASSSDKDDDGFSWSLKVSMDTATGSKAKIPYKKAEAVVYYTADSGTGGINSVKNIRLTNIISYPPVHTMSIYEGENSDISECEECLIPPDNKKNSDPDDPDESQYKVVKGDAELSFKFNYSVKKDIKAAYTISVIAKDKASPDNLDSLDTIYSTFFLDGKKMAGRAATRTPIMSQPTFNLIDVRTGVSAGEHTISVRWVKRTENGSSTNSAGEMWLVSGSLSIIATEPES